MKDRRNLGAFSELRAIEVAVRSWRKRLFARAMSGRRGRKLLLDAMPGNVISLTVDCGDHCLTISPREMIGRHVFAQGDFGRADVNKVISVLDEEHLLPREGATLLELGANIGTHSVYFGLSGRFDRIIAVEPDPGNLAFLRRNLDDNSLSEIVRIAPCAAGAAKADLDLVQITGNSGSSSFKHAADGHETVRVPVRTVPDILHEAGVDESAVTLVWMDAEGYEPEICLGMTPLLSRRVPVFTEFSPELMSDEDIELLIKTLSKHYDRCMIFSKTGHCGSTPEELRRIKSQCDVLMLP